MTKYIFFAGGMEEGNRDMKIRSTAVMSTSALTWRSSCPGVVCKITQSCFRTGFTHSRSPCVGKMKAQLTEAKIPYEIRITRYEELAKSGSGRWHSTTENTFDPGTLRVLGVHVIGENAARLSTSRGSSLGSTIKCFATRCLTHPTLAESLQGGGPGRVE